MQKRKGREGGSQDSKGSAQTQLHSHSALEIPFILGVFLHPRLTSGTPKLWTMVDQLNIGHPST